jgi:hypothetical protein
MKAWQNFSKTKTLFLAILILSSGLTVATTAIRRTAAWESSGGGTLTQTPATFSNYELAGNPFIPGASVGVTCPNTQRTCQNTEAEPAIRADRSGNFYGASEK